MSDSVKILFIGDIIGRPGRSAMLGLMPALLEEFAPDLVIANGENAAGGFGITPDIAEELRGYGVDVITSGNHIWDRKEIYDYIEGSSYLVRPANYPEGSPGAGSVVVEGRSGVSIGVVNLAGRVFMDALDCPFAVGRGVVDEVRKETPVIIVDIHAETTSEKAAVGWFFNGEVSAVIGTHTHVQTSDETVLSGGTAYITDAGMTGPTDSVIGMRKEIVLERFTTQLPRRFEVATKGVELQGVLVTVGSADGRATGIERIKRTLG
jgi:metallophosphoesterase (TIGR00282 family)